MLLRATRSIVAIQHLGMSINLLTLFAMVQANFKPIRSVCRHTALQCEVT
jgi:hypothetical protein